MRYAFVAMVLLFAAVVRGADDPPGVSATLNGKQVKLSEKGLADGVKAALGLLESCCSEGLYQANEREKALRGQYVRLVFAKPTPTTVMGKKLEIAELVFRMPMNTGVFWVRTGNKWRRYSKYQFKKQEPFEAWLRKARQASRD